MDDAGCRLHGVLVGNGGPQSARCRPVAAAIRYRMHSQYTSTARLKRRTLQRSAAQHAMIRPRTVRNTAAPPPPAQNGGVCVCHSFSGIAPRSPAGISPARRGKCLKRSPVAVARNSCAVAQSSASHIRAVILRAIPRAIPRVIPRLIPRVSYRRCMQLIGRRLISARTNRHS